MTLMSEMFLFLNVDNTLLDNDCIVADLSACPKDGFGGKNRDRYWAVF